MTHTIRQRHTLQINESICTNLFGLIRLALVIAAVFFSATICSASATSVYVAQNSSGAANGAGCADAFPVSWLNTSANWGSGGAPIGPGTTVYLCGTITTELSIEGSGTNGRPIILTCAPGGCDLTAPAGNLIDLNGQSYIILDGGSPCGPSVNQATCTGIAENTANGSGLANQLATRFVDRGTNSCNIEVRNWLIRNLYQHTSTSDRTIDQSFSNAFYANPMCGMFSFHDNTVHDVGWALEFQSYTANTTLDIHDNYLYNYDHGVAVAVTSTSAFATVKIHDNHFGTTANWDTTANVYHHDGVHLFAATTWSPSWTFYIFNNLFDGDWGGNNTAHLYNEENPPNVIMFNNVHIQFPGNYLNNGFIAMQTTGSYNNTYIGANVPSQHAIGLGSTTSIPFKNNLITGVNTFIHIGSGNTFSAGSPSNNIYAGRVPGGNDPFYYGTTLSTFSAWQSATNGDFNFSAEVSNARLSPSGTPLGGSAVIGTGANLTSLCTGVLTALCSTTSAGGTVTPVARPTSGPWDVGAFQYNNGSGNSNQPAPPTGLSVTVQ